MNSFLSRTFLIYSWYNPNKRKLLTLRNQNCEGYHSRSILHYGGWNNESIEHT